MTYRRDCEQGNIWVDVLTAKTTRILYVVYASVPIEHRSDAQATLESIVKTFAVTSDLTIEQYRKVLRANIEAHPPNPAALAVTPTYIAEKASDVWRSGRREEAITMFCRINEIDDRQTLAAFGIGMRESERPGEEKEAIQELTSYSTNTTDGKSTDGRERLSLARATLNRLLHGATSR